MDVRVAETAGFCFGVQRAVDKVYELIATGTAPIYTLGPIIHNEEVVADLERKGVSVIEEEQIPGITEGTVVIRSHGVGQDVYDKLKKPGISCVDVTCPFVLKIHRIVERESRKGAHIVIIGDPTHPEVQGICGWCQGDYTVIKSLEHTLRQRRTTRLKKNSTLKIFHLLTQKACCHRSQLSVTFRRYLAALKCKNNRSCNITGSNYRRSNFYRVIRTLKYGKSALAAGIKIDSTVFHNILKRC